MTESAQHPWSIVYYQEANGLYPAAEFVLGLSEAASATLQRDFDLLEEFGLAVGFPTVRPVASVRKLWELRTKTADGAVRLFYVAYTGRQFVILHGFIKKTAKTPKRELKTAIKRLRDLLAQEV